MKSTVAVTRKRHISPTPDVVWSVITTPEMHVRLDSRCHLESATGGSEAGSEYVVTVRAGVGSTRLRYVIREAIRETRWIADVGRGGK